MGYGELKVIEGGKDSPDSDPEWGSVLWAEKLRKETAEIAVQLDAGYMKLAEKLWMIYDTPVDGDPNRASICTSWKDKSGNYYTSFDKYVDAELRINYKKAQRLRAIWKTFKVDLQLDDATLARVVKLGFSKVRELARPGVLTERNVGPWLEKAEKLTCLKLMTAVTKYLADKATERATFEAEKSFEQEYNGSLGSVPVAAGAEAEVDEEAERDERRIGELAVSSRQFNCMLFDDQIETVNLAMKRSMELSNSDKVGHNLSLICLDFLATNDFKFADETQRLRFLVKYEQLLGVKMILVDPEVGDVVYGIKTLEKLARSE